MKNSKVQCLLNSNNRQLYSCLKNSNVEEVDIYVLEAQGLTALWIAAQKKNGLSYEQIDIKAATLGISGFVSSNGSTIHGIKDFYTLAEDLKKGGSILTRYEITPNGNKSYIKFKGNHKLRSLIKGTRYLSSNAKILALGIGMEGLKKSAKTGGIVTIIYSVSFRTLEFALIKNYSVSDWFTNISADLVKAAVSTVIGIIAGSMLIASQGVVVVPVMTALAAAFFTGWLLDYFDGRYLIKEKIVSGLNDYMKIQARMVIDKEINKGLSSRAAYSLRINNQGFLFK